MRRKGFTLIELVVVITVIGILAAVLVPAFTVVIKAAAKAADVQQLKELHTLMLTGEIGKGDLKNYELQTKGWVLAYNETTEELVIIDESTNEIVAANDSKTVGQIAEGFRKASDIEDDPGGGDGDGGGGSEPGGGGSEPGGGGSEPGGGGSEPGGGGSEPGGGGSEPGGGEDKDPDDGGDGGGEEDKEPGTGGDDGGDKEPDESEDDPFWADAVRWADIADEAARKSADKIYIDDTVAEIPDGYFSGCALRCVYIGKGITKLPTNAFYNCAALTTVEIAGELTEIGTNAFSGCQSLSKIELDYVQTIGSRAFFKCVNLKELKLPATLKTIHRYSFYGCTFDSLTIPGVNITQYENDDFNFGVKEFTIDGGKFCPDFYALIRHIISHGELDKIIINDIYFDDNFETSPFKGMSKDMIVEVKSSIYEEMVKRSDPTPFGSAQVTLF